jgi:hypothetical protein
MTITLNPAMLVAAKAVRGAGKDAFDAFLTTLDEDVRNAVAEQLAAIDKAEMLLAVEKQLDPRADTEAVYDAAVVIAEQMATYKDVASNATGWKGNTLHGIVTPFGSIKVTLTTQFSPKK